MQVYVKEASMNRAWSIAITAALVCATFAHAAAFAQQLVLPASGKRQPAAQAPRVVLDDMRNFATALAEIKAGDEPVAAIQLHYLDRASEGLRAFVRRRGMTAKELAAAVTARPRYYAALSELWSRPEESLQKIDAALKGVHRIYPQSQLLPVYLFVGNFSSGGLADPAGALISVEFYGDAKGADLSELGSLRRSVRRLGDIGHLAAHEMVHIQQAIAQGVENYMRLYDGSGTLLQFAVREGSADFLAELASGGHTNPEAHAFGRQHEGELWRAFTADLDSTDVGSWMFERPKTPGWPAALGYFIGYRIAEAYYRSSASPDKAVREILAATDAPAFLRASGYRGSAGR
jgi:hypothetical protein